MTVQLNLAGSAETTISWCGAGGGESYVVCCHGAVAAAAAGVVLPPPPPFIEQEGLAVASIVRDDPSTLPGDDRFPRTRMHRDRNAR